jgi:hypothetical protein
VQRGSEPLEAKRGGEIASLPLTKG